MKRKAGKSHDCQRNDGKMVTCYPLLREGNSVKKVFVCGVLMVFLGGLVLAAPQPEEGRELNVYYGMSASRMEPLLDEFSKAFPDIRINSFRQPTEELLATIELELRAGRPGADVIVGVDAQMASLQDQFNAFEPYSAKEINSIPQDYRYPNDYLTTIAASFYVIQYNTNSVSKSEVPASWADLLNPRWNNQLIIADPRSSASVHKVVWFLSTHLGESQGAPYGWEYFEEFGRLNPRYIGSHGTISDLVASGERPVGVQMMQVVETSISRGEPTWWVYPSEGSPGETTAVGVVRGARNRTAAQKFVDFLVSREGQEAVGRHINLSPVRSGLSYRYPDGKRIDDIEVVVPDLDFLNVPENRMMQAERFHELMQ